MSTITLTNAIAVEDNGGITANTLIAYQRNTAGNTDVNLSGAYTVGTPTHVEYTLNGGSTWTGVSSEVISGGAWSGTLLSVAKGDYTVSVRWSNSTGVTATSFLAVGDVFGPWGDSTATDGTGVFPSGPCTGPFKTWIWNLNHSNWFDATSVIYQGWATFLGTNWVTDKGCPAIFIPLAESGKTLMNHWNGTTWKNSGPTTEQTRALSLISGSGVNAVRYMPGMILANDVSGATASALTLVKADLIAALDDLAAQFAANITGAPTTYVEAPLSEVGDAGSLFPDTWGSLYRTNVDLAKQAATGVSVAHVGANLTGQTYVSGGGHTHPDTATYGQQIADRFWAQLTGTTCPVMTSVQQDTAKTHIYINTNKALSLAGDAACFAVLDAGTPVTVSSTTLVTSTQIKLTLASATTGAVTVYYGSGYDASGATVPLSTAFPSATGGTMTQPLQPFFAVTPGAYTPTSTACASVFAGCLR